MKTARRFAVLASMMAASASGVAAQEAGRPSEIADIDKLAEALSDCPPVEVAQSNPDGTRPDVPCTRQWVKGKVVRQDIRMSFELGSAALTGQAKATLDRFAAGLLKIGAFRPFAVEGHTDSSGGRELNAALSRARAQAVVDYLAGKGVDSARLTARGLGYQQPLEGRTASDPRNRRVEVVAR
ncbi:OmpA family protein [Polymorphobacter multimanifer]|uniref:Outer membrane protein OmpA-like peptidoglycan-associated protein n=1 Tax=Polymorphobacter multimanifer TaxID=1070431 RepID=A0A841L3Q8_9SPHN|nr:OmpA family protein [Polymorphobacter multimanifer]MBB6227479.1 outer membrane protein OmpA-like peptidoglycan-associated protein [Polymorphobacter multimanifer]